MVSVESEEEFNMMSVELRLCCEQRVGDCIVIKNEIRIKQLIEMKPSYLSCLYPHFSAQQNAVKGDSREWWYVWTMPVSCPVAVMLDSGPPWSGSVSPTVRASTPPG